MWKCAANQRLLGKTERTETKKSIKGLTCGVSERSDAKLWRPTAKELLPAGAISSRTLSLDEKGKNTRGGCTLMPLQLWSIDGCKREDKTTATRRERPYRVAGLGSARVDVASLEKAVELPRKQSHSGGFRHKVYQEHSPPSEDGT